MVKKPLYSQLLGYEQFILWKKEIKNGRKTKVPYSLKTGRETDVNNRNNWSSYSEVLMKSMLDDNGFSFSGIGFALAKDDPFFFIDLDDCIENGEILSWAKKIINKFPTYWEFSPSGKGLHAYGIGKIPEKYLNGKTGKKKEIYDDNKKGKIEIYEKGRFFTFTENPLQNTNEISDCQNQLEQFMADSFSINTTTSKKYSKISKEDLEELNKVDVPNLMKNLGISDQIIDNWVENIADGEDKSPSGKDLKMILQVLGKNRNISDIELIALIQHRRIRSNEEPGKAGRADYLQGTIDCARSRLPRGEDEFCYVKIENSHINSKNDTWLEPYDFFGDSSITGEVRLEKEMLPDVIANYSFDTAKRLGVAPEMVALPCLAVIASVIHDDFKIQPKVKDTKWLENARLWIAIVAAPGSKKTPAINEAIEPLSFLEKQWRKEYEKEFGIYEMAKSHYEKNEKNKKSLEFLEKPIEPRQRRVKVNDATIESLGNILSDNHGGVLSVQDELMGLIGSMDAYKSNKTGKDRTAWLELHNGGSISIDRVNKNRSLFINNWSACVVGGIQSEKLRSISSNLLVDGLLQRFVPVFGKNTKEFDIEPDQNAQDDYHNAVKKLSALEPPCNTKNSNKAITLSKEAQKHRKEVADIIDDIKKIPETTSAMIEHLDKWNGLFVRLLIVFHFLQHITQDSIVQEVEGKTAEQVKNLMLKVLLPNSAKFYNELIGRDEKDQHAKWIANYIISRNAESITIHDIKRKYSSLRKADNYTILSIMQVLESMSWVRAVEGSNGRPPKQWNINPLVHSKFALQAEKERKRREDVRKEIAQSCQNLKLQKIIN